METDVTAISPIMLFFGPGEDPGGEEPDEPEQEEKSDTDTPEREEPSKPGEKTEHPRPQESNTQLQ